ARSLEGLSPTARIGGGPHPKLEAPSGARSGRSGVNPSTRDEAGLAPAGREPQAVGAVVPSGRLDDSEEAAVAPGLHQVVEMRRQRVAGLAAGDHEQRAV